jgi:transposase
MNVPGVGPLISTGIVAAIVTGEALERGRAFGAWFGLVPDNTAPAVGRYSAEIPKRGSEYLRTLSVQAAKVRLMRPHD